MIVFVPLTNGGYTKINEEDLSEVRKHEWFLDKFRGRSYATRLPKKGFPKTVRLHSFLMGNHRGKVIDHKNGDGLDNTRGNLRIVSQTVNCLNLKNVKGYSYYSRRGVYVVKINAFGITFNLGRFKKESDAKRTATGFRKKLISLIEKIEWGAK